ncbi:transglutaminase domain-containing protein [Mycoplasmopsis lipofaciens]|uniref:transglutaminase domain-containing protein n=1 Tax=Mycoplasmopsis lipofaciens TaxID=114884 RepID=UPI0004817284|nr:transglutaminase domain-containing protein [Mycoplasmopsis lipofaciens]
MNKKLIKKIKLCSIIAMTPIPFITIGCNFNNFFNTQNEKDKSPEEKKLNELINEAENIIKTDNSFDIKRINELTSAINNAKNGKNKVINNNDFLVLALELKKAINKFQSVVVDDENIEIPNDSQDSDDDKINEVNEKGVSKINFSLYKNEILNKAKIKKALMKENILKIIGNKNVNLNNIRQKIQDQNQLNKAIYLANLVNRIRKQLLNFSNDVYDYFYLRGERYNISLHAFENFVKQYLTQANIKNIIITLINSFNGSRFNIEQILANEKYFEFNINQISKYLDNVQRDIDLTFDNTDSYIVNFNKLDFLKNRNKFNWISDEDIYKIRKNLLFAGTAHIRNLKYFKPFVIENEENDIVVRSNFQELIYDLTGGANYYNDVTELWTGSGIDNNIYNFSFKYRTSNANEEIQVNEFVKNKIKDIISIKMSKRQKIESVHNWIIDYIDYSNNKDLNDPSKSEIIRSPYTFVTFPQNQQGVVCEGYARMFQKFMTFLNIESWYITGPVLVNGVEQPHAWNMVKIDDEYLFVDCTFDDPVILGNNISIQSKSITPHSRKHLLVTWKQLAFDENNNKIRTVDKEYLYLQQFWKERNKLDMYSVKFPR